MDRQPYTHAAGFLLGLYAAGWTNQRDILPHVRKGGQSFSRSPGL
jgi:hypothetical protein